MSRTDLRKRLAALEGPAAGSGGPRVLLILPDDGSGAPGFDGDGRDEAVTQPRRRHYQGPEMHIFGADGCAFIAADATPCTDDHGALAAEAEQRP